MTGTIWSLRLAWLTAMFWWGAAILDGRWYDSGVAITLALLAQGLLGIWKRLNS